MISYTFAILYRINEILREKGHGFMDLKTAEDLWAISEYDNVSDEEIRRWVDKYLFVELDIDQEPGSAFPIDLRLHKN